METTARSAVPTGSGNGSEDTLIKAVDRVAESAHQAVDKAASVAAPAAEWLSQRSESLNATRKSIVADANQYVTANPWRFVGVALAAGLLIGRILR